jgi:hypothetical protein
MCEQRYYEISTLSGDLSDVDATALNLYKVACTSDLNNLPKPIGCFRDHFERDLKSQLGIDLSIKQCR